jgi:UPF0716 protein FxsA
MAYIILVFMIGVPLAEIAVFIEVGGRIGLWPTIATVVLTAMIGTALLRRQGLATLRKVQESLEQNRLPLAEVFDGLCLLAAGALLLTPGFVTDAVGFLLFFPPFRAALRLLAARYWISSGRVVFHNADPSAPGPQNGRAGPTIEGDYQEIDPGNDNDPERPPPPRIPR